MSWRLPSPQCSGFEVPKLAWLVLHNLLLRWRTTGVQAASPDSVVYTSPQNTAHLTAGPRILLTRQQAPEYCSPDSRSQNTAHPTAGPRILLTRQQVQAHLQEQPCDMVYSRPLPRPTPPLSTSRSYGYGVQKHVPSPSWREKNHNTFVEWRVRPVGSCYGLNFNIGSSAVPSWFTKSPHSPPVSTECTYSCMTLHSALTM